MTWTDIPQNADDYLRNVSVTNVGDKDVVLTWNSVPYVIRAGTSESVPFDAVRMWCGHPLAGEMAHPITVRGESSWVPSRFDEVQRLRLLYGMHNLGGAADIVSGVDPETGQLVDYPRLRVMHGDERLYTVLEAPDGSPNDPAPVNPHVARVQQEQQDLLARMEQEINALRQQLNRQEAGLEPPNHTPYVPTAESDLDVDDAPDPTAPPLPQRPTDNIDFESAHPDEEFEAEPEPRGRRLGRRG